jgi:hypothetical protein
MGLVKRGRMALFEREQKFRIKTTGNNVVQSFVHSREGILRIVGFDECSIADCRRGESPMASAGLQALPCGPGIADLNQILQGRWIVDFDRGKRGEPGKSCFRVQEAPVTCVTAMVFPPWWCVESA